MTATNLSIRFRSPACVFASAFNGNKLPLADVGAGYNADVHRPALFHYVEAAEPIDCLLDRGGGLRAVG